MPAWWLWLLACTSVGTPDTDTGGGEVDTEVDTDGPVDTSAPDTGVDTDTDCDLVWFPDADGDGFGDEAGAVGGCAPPDPSWTGQGGDCNDTDAAVFPGQVERCNELDDDCDPSTSEAGLATYTRYDGQVEDLTAVLSAGAPGAPVDYTTPGTNGVLRLCEGTWYVSVLLNANVDIVGVGAGRTVLSGGGVARVVYRGHQYQDLVVRRLTVQDGLSAGTYGGALFFSAGDTALVEDVEVLSSAAGQGGGVGVDSGSVTLRRVTLRGNSATGSGGALYVQGNSTYGAGQLTLEDVTIEQSTGGDAALWVGAQGTVSATGVQLVSNSPAGVGTQGGGVATGLGADFSCTETGCN